MNRILLVDDDAQFRTMLREMLNREGYKVIEATDGHDVLNICIKTSVDLVVTDIVMPEKEGLETITELRRNLCV